MPEKTTSSMLVRAIPIDVWERIDKLCRRKNMKRRDFVEQALRFFEEEEVEQDRKQSDSVQPPDIDRLKSDVEDLKKTIKKNKERQKVEQRIDTTGQKNRIDMELRKPESADKLTMKRPDSGIRTLSPEEKNKEVLTTVYCWGLDA